jgi:hypothetical protein
MFSLEFLWGIDTGAVVLYDVIRNSGRMAIASTSVPSAHRLHLKGSS